MGSSKPYKNNTESFQIVDQENGRIIDVFVTEWTTYCYSSGNHVEHTKIELYQENGGGWLKIANETGISSWCNRPWQRFDYDNSRSAAVSKMQAAFQPQLRAVLLDGKADKVRKECEAFTKAFAAGWDALNDKSRKQIAETVETIETEGEARAALALVQLSALLQD